jgi:lipoprotein-anchoring transpeptidase ErfK/SrfK
MKVSVLVSAAITAITLSVAPAGANDRYASRPPVLVSPDLSAPWVMQLQNRQTRRTVPVVGREVRRNREVLVQPARISREQNYRQKQRHALSNYRTLAATGAPSKREARQEMDPRFLPQQVEYETGYAPGTIVIDSAEKFLYLVQSGGTARRYGVGVGTKVVVM